MALEIFEVKEAFVFVFFFEIYCGPMLPPDGTFDVCKILY